MKTILWVDDFRDPAEFLQKHTPYNVSDNNVVWVKNEDEFKHFILTKGIPDVVCFDHDLGIEEKVGSGYTCAKILVEILMNKNFADFPEYYIQSSNPVGVNNIDGLIKSYKNFSKRFH